MNSLIGIGLRHPHYQEVLQKLPSIGWLEVHSENFFQAGGPALDCLKNIREHYPISLHGVGLSLGSATGIDLDHLIRLKKLIEFIQPFLVSEHLSWSRLGDVYLPDLLPIPYTSESFNILSDNINKTQDFLECEILVENPSSYLEYQSSHFEEVEFLVNLCQKTGAKMLLDVNNVFVSCSNHDRNARSYLDAIPKDLVHEIHLAGHSTTELAPNHNLRVDTHDNYVSTEVWDLYEYTLEKVGPKHTLIEWDAQIPSLDILIEEAQKATAYIPVCKDNNNTGKDLQPTEAL